MDKVVQEQAIQRVMGQLNLTANDVNRYIADAVLEHDLLKAEVERLRAALTAAEKTIYDAETYFDMGSAKYAYKQIKDYQAKKEAARAALEGGGNDAE